jgi:DNA-binding SARP family transcriptional activator
MAIVKVHLFGKCTVECDGLELKPFEAGKVRDMFAYLVFHNGRSHAREALAGLFWDNSTSAQARKYLRQTLWQLQSHLDIQRPHDAFLDVDADWVSIATASGLQVDVAVFEAAVNASRGISAAALDHQQVALLHEAVKLYRGDLLEGCYLDWCLYERERLQNTFLSILDKLMRNCEFHRQYEDGLEYGTRILRIDRARERTHRVMMHLYYLLGDRTGALRQYQRCALALREELDVAPSPQTQGLFAQVRANALAEEPILAALKIARPPSGESLPALIERLHLIYSTLDETRLRLLDNIHAVEHVLGENNPNP